MVGMDTYGGVEAEHVVLLGSRMEDGLEGFMFGRNGAEVHRSRSGKLVGKTGVYGRQAGAHVEMATTDETT